MSTDYVAMILADIQGQIRALNGRIDAIEDALAADEGDEVETYMDGTPVR